MRNLSKIRLLRITVFFGLIIILVIALPSRMAYAANCDGLPTSGGTIPAGTYTMTDNCAITATLEIDSGTVTIDGGGFTISGGGIHRVFLIYFDSTLNLNNVVVTDGHDNRSGGSIYIGSGTVTITDSIITNNSAGRGGGISNNGMLTITDSIITNNSADYGGGISNNGGSYNGGGTLTIHGSTISGNSATFGGGINSLHGTMTINNSTISGNSATFGGGISNNDDTVIINNSTISGNSASFLGGGISNGGTMDIYCSSIEGNTTADPRHYDVQLGILGNLTAEYNWWGAITGPNTPGADTTNIRVSAWLNAPDASPCSAPTTQVTQATPITPTVPDVTVIGSPTSESIQPICNLISDITAYDLPDGFYCRVLMQDGAWQTDPGTIPQELIDNGVILGVDIFQLSGQQEDNEFGVHVPVCLLGSGRLIFLDATTSPRTMVELETFTQDDMTCGWIPNAGTLVLIEGG